jgi:UDP-N-acetylglucosamine acyltransferase
LDHTLPAAGISPDAVVSRAAHVAPGASIAAGCRVGPGCVVGADCVLEEGVELISHVVLDGRTRLGKGVRVFPFATIGLAPQDLKYTNEPTGVLIGPRTVVREHATIHRGSVGGDGWTRIGDDCLIMCVAHIGHDCRLGNGVVLVNQVMLAGHVDIGDHAVMHGGSAAQQFSRIGRMALVTGGCGVERNVVPFGRVKGYRAKLAGLNTIAMRRRLGMSKEQVITIAQAVHHLYRGGRPEEQVEEVAAAYPGNPHVGEILDFVRDRGRHGLVAFGRGGEDDDLEAG